MENCYLTQLLSRVNNNNLEHIGFIKFKSMNTTGIQLRLEPGAIIRSFDGNFNVDDYIYNVTEHVNVRSESQILYIQPNVEGMSIEISKYSIAFLSDINMQGSQQNTFTLDINDAAFVKDRIYLYNNSNILGDIASLDILDSLAYIRCYDTYIQGNLSDFDVKNLEELSLARTLVQGDLSNFDVKGLIKLDLAGSKIVGSVERFNVKNLTYLDLGNTNFVGDLQAMATYSWNQGRKTGNMRIGATASGESEQKRMWGNQTMYEACGNKNPWIVFTNEGVSLSAAQPA